MTRRITAARMEALAFRTGANLHAAADLLTQYADLPCPYITTSSDGTVDLNWFFTLGHIRGDLDERTAAATVVRAIDGKWDREDRDDTTTWTQRQLGLTLLVQVSRAAVCERVVTGTEAVTVPAVEATPARIETREVVEWRCEPLLAAHATREAPVTLTGAVAK